MTRGEMIERLEVLLARVRMRGTRQRGGHDETRAGSPEVTVDVDMSGLHREAVIAENTEPSLTSDEHDSRERLVAAEALAPESARRSQPTAPAIDTGEVEVEVTAEATGEVARDEEEEKPPISSRRTVSSEPEERLAEMAFGAEEPRPPLHTPPPESGRLPAAAVADFDHDSDFAGARDATPMLPRRTGDSLPRELSPEATKPHRVPSEAVAEVITEAQRFVPSTFVAMLDASLSL